MLEVLPDHFPSLAKMKSAAGEQLYQFAMFGMTTPQLIDMKVIVGAIVVGVGSALAVGYVNGERNAVKLDVAIQRIEQSNREQAEFRTETRALMAQRSMEYLSIAERQARVEAILGALHPQAGMGGGNGGRKQ